MDSPSELSSIPKKGIRWFLSQAVFEGLQNIFWMIPLVGIAGGLTGMAYLKVLRILENFLSPEGINPLVHLGIMAGVGLLIGLIPKFLGSPGDVELMVNNIHMSGGHKDVRALRSLIPVSLISIAAGGAAGPEAPLVQTTGTLGTWISLRRNLTKDERRILTITGMASGFTVLFGAPLGAAIFALEILHRRGLEYYEALIPAMVGSVCGYALYTAATGMGLAPAWIFPAAPQTREVDLLWSLAAGVVAAAAVTIFTYSHLLIRKIFHKFPPVVRPVMGGIALGAVSLVSAYALTSGENQIGSLLYPSLTLKALGVAILIKILCSSITISSGWRGGYIIPLFFIGVALGRIAHGVFPMANEVLLMAAFMASMTSGVTKTVIGSTLVVTEMTGLPLLPTTLIAALVTIFLTSEVGLIDTQRKREDISE